MTNPDVLARRLLQRAHTRDGLMEMLAGILLLGVAGLQYGSHVLPRGSFLLRACPLVFLAVLLLLPRGIRWLQQHYLVEREGYVEHLPRRFRPARFAAGAAAGAGIAFLLGARTTQEWWLTGFIGVAGGISAALSGRQPRFYFAGAVMAATGLAVALARLPVRTGFVILCGVMGVLELLLGGFTLLRFLSETREAGPDER